jgi:cytochrome c-type biogenesis protein CcmE
MVASEVLAKHDEEYMPPEVQYALDSAHQEGVKNLQKNVAEKAQGTEADALQESQSQSSTEKQY